MNMARHCVEDVPRWNLDTHRQNSPLKVVLIGESAVGKSSVFLRFVKGEFHEFHESTIGAAFMHHRMTVDEKSVQFDIWDTAGQERFHCLVPMFYRGAQAAIAVYDVTNMETFEKAKKWIKDVQRHGSPDAIIALAGNKADLAEEARAVEYNAAQEYADENHLLFMETSAKTAMNVHEIFMEIARKSECRPTSTSHSHSNGHILGPDIKPGGWCCK